MTAVEAAEVVIGTDELALDDLVAIANGARVRVSDDAWRVIETGRAIVDRLVHGEALVSGSTPASATCATSASPSRCCAPLPVRRGRRGTRRGDRRSAPDRGGSRDDGRPAGGVRHRRQRR